MSYTPQFSENPQINISSFIIHPITHSILKETSYTHKHSVTNVSSRVETNLQKRSHFSKTSLQPEATHLDSLHNKLKKPFSSHDKYFCSTKTNPSNCQETHSPSRSHYTHNSHRQNETYSRPGDERDKIRDYVNCGRKHPDSST